MREAKRFGSRSRALDSDEVKLKYYLVFEGKNTERIYFEAVDHERGRIGLNSIIELVPIIRSFNEDSWSNPKKIVDCIIRELNERDSGVLPYSSIVNRIMDYLEDEKIVYKNRPLMRSIGELLSQICKDELGVQMDDECEDMEADVRRMLELLEEKTQLANLVENADKIITRKILNYDGDVDKLCFIVDRDRESFKAEQYMDVVDKCKRNKFNLYITNPCFEYWLLMHYEDFCELDDEEVAKNEKVSRRWSYVERELRNRCPGYDKSKYDAISMLANIDRAICNEHTHCEDIEGLENQIGSNVGILITEMRNC